MLMRDHTLVIILSCTQTYEIHICTNSHMRAHTPTYSHMFLCAELVLLHQTIDGCKRESARVERLLRARIGDAQAKAELRAAYTQLQNALSRLQGNAPPAPMSPLPSRARTEGTFCITYTTHTGAQAKAELRAAYT